MPEPRLDGLINNYGLRLGWMRNHTCPCTMGAEYPGSPDPGCNTCLGRGIYWEQPVAFSGLMTYMHTSSAPDEPGFHTDPVVGQVSRAEPTLTIPALPGSTIWQNASAFDAYIEYDATARFNTALVVGQNTALPYPFGVEILGVTAWNPATKTTYSVPIVDILTEGGFPLLTESGSPLLREPTYLVNGTTVTLPGFEDGIAYVVEYTAQPVFIAYRSAGGSPHTRPFGLGGTLIPRRFHIQTLDIWFRSRETGDPAFPVVGPYSP